MPGRPSVVALLVVFAACDVGDVTMGAGNTNTGVDGGGSGSATVDADTGTGSGASLRVTVTTSPSGGNYAPRNIVAIWIENQGAFVKTIGRWADTRKQYLVAWNAAAGTTDADAVSGATRSDHAQPLAVTWNLQDKQSAVVADGTYTIRMEVADENATTAGQNNQGTFTFIKGADPQSQTALSNGGFSNVSIEFTP